MASPPPYILAVCFENCLRQRRFLRRSQQNGYAAASIFAILKGLIETLSKITKRIYSPNHNLCFLLILLHKKLLHNAFVLKNLIVKCSVLVYAVRFVFLISAFFGFYNVCKAVGFTNGFFNLGTYFGVFRKIFFGVFSSLTNSVLFVRIP